MDALPDMLPTDTISAMHDAALEQLVALAGSTPENQMTPPVRMRLHLLPTRLPDTGPMNTHEILPIERGMRCRLERHSTLFPWIVWCELELAETGTLARRNHLLDVRNQLHQRQIPPMDTRFGMALAGGYVLGRTPSDVTSQSLRPGSALPAMLRSRDLTGTEQTHDEWNRVRAGAGFLLSLQVTSEGAVAVFKCEAHQSVAYAVLRGTHGCSLLLRPWLF